jgi:hypothetical protein
MRAIPWPRSSIPLVRLALPIVAVQVGLMMMGVVDTLMVGRVSAAALAAVALGNIYFFSRGHLRDGGALRPGPRHLPGGGRAGRTWHRPGLQRG